MKNIHVITLEGDDVMIAHSIDDEMASDYFKQVKKDYDQRGVSVYMVDANEDPDYPFEIWQDENGNWHTDIDGEIS